MRRHPCRAAQFADFDPESPFALPQVLVERVMVAALEAERRGARSSIVVADVRRTEARAASIYCIESKLAGIATVAAVRAQSPDGRLLGVGLVIIDARGELHGAVMGSLIPHAGAA